MVLFQLAMLAALLAVSVQIVLMSGQFSLASIGFWTIGAYAAAALAKNGWSLLPIALTVTVISGVLGYVAARPLSRLRGLYLAMVTVAFSSAIPLLALNLGDLTGGAIGLFGVPIQAGVGALFVVLLITLYVVSQAQRGWMRRAHTALREDETLARSVGVQQGKETAFVFGLSAAVGGLVGSLNALSFGSVSPQSGGFALVVTAMTAVMIGGQMSWVGAVIGGVTVTLVPEYLRFVGEWRNLVYGIVLVLVVLFAREGILGLLGRIHNKILARTGEAR